MVDDPSRNADELYDGMPHLFLFIRGVHGAARTYPQPIRALIRQLSV